MAEVEVGGPKGRRPDPDGLGGGPCLCRAKGQCHHEHQAGVELGQDRSADGSVKRHRIDGNAPCIGAAERILDLMGLAAATSRECAKSHTLSAYLGASYAYRVKPLGS